MKAIKINGLSWDVENLKVFGLRHFNQIIAKFFVKIVGKRLPTKEEFEALANLPNVWDEEKKGYWFAENEEDLKNPEKSLFLPAAGYLNYNNITWGLRDILCSAGLSGDYWSSTTDSITTAFNLHFSSNWLHPAIISPRGDNNTIRCINK